MKKSKLKEMNPNRRRALMLLRKDDSMKQHPYIDREGKEIVLNIKKHMLNGKPFANQEYQMELERVSAEMIQRANKEVEENNG